MDTPKSIKPLSGWGLIFLLCCLFVISSFGCGPKGEALVLPVAEDVVKYTVQEYLGDAPVSIEAELPYGIVPGGTYFYHGKSDGWKQITDPNIVPLKQTSLLFQFTKQDGTVAKAFLYGDDTYNYLELPGKGVWREQIKKSTNRFPWEMKNYRNATFTACFLEPAQNGRLKLMDAYTGAGKAIWIDITGERDAWWDRYIPSEWCAERPEDVRYAIVAGLKSKEHKGYWYVPGTGQNLGSAYNTSYSVVAYDLVTGEETTIEDGVSMFHREKIHAFFADKG